MKAEIASDSEPGDFLIRAIITTLPCTGSNRHHIVSLGLVLCPEQNNQTRCHHDWEHNLIHCQAEKRHDHCSYTHNEDSIAPSPFVRDETISDFGRNEGVNDVRRRRKSRRKASPFERREIRHDDVSDLNKTDCEQGH